MSLPHLRLLRLGEILNGSFTLLRRHVAVMCATALAFFVPLWLLDVLWQRFGPQQVSMTSAMALSAAWEVLEWGVALFAWAALAHQFSRAYVGEEVDLGDGLRAAASAMGRLLGAVAVLLPSLVATAIVLMIPLPLAADVLSGTGANLLALVLALGAAMAWAPRLFALIPAVVVEGLRPLAALERSERLGRVARWRVMGVAALVCALNLLPILVSRLMVLAWQAAEGPARGPLAAAGMVVQQTVSLLAGATTLPLAVGCLVLLYHDLRVRAGEPGLEVGTAAAPA